MFIYDRIEWGEHARIRVYFHHVGSLREGAPLVVAGRSVGTIETIALSPRGTPSPLNGDEGVVVIVALSARDAQRIDRGGDVFVASRGALSDRYLELGPAPSPGTPLHDGDQLLGRDPPSLDRVLERTWDNLTTLGAFANELRPEFISLRTQIDELRTHFDSTAATIAIPNVDRLGPLIDDAISIAAEVRHLREVGLGGPTGMAHLSAVIDHARILLADARTNVDKLSTSATTLRTSFESLRQRLGTKGAQAIDAVELAIDRIRADIAKIDPLVAEIQAINDRIARGEGTLLKLMNDPEFPEDAKELGKILKRQPWKVVSHPTD